MSHCIFPDIKQAQPSSLAPSHVTGKCLSGALGALENYGPHSVTGDGLKAPEAAGV